MRTKMMVLVSAAFFMFLAVCGAVEPPNTAVNQETLDKAKQDYRVFLSQLKQLNKEYKQVSGQIAQVVREEGVPTWDNNTDSLGFTKDLSPAASSQDIRIQENDKEMNVSIDLPGLKKNSIKANIEDVKLLKISATRTIGQETLPIEKVVRLPAAAQGEGTKAKYEDGVLMVKIPKAANKEIAVPIN